jgi:uncharacterized protein
MLRVCVAICCGLFLGQNIFAAGISQWGEPYKILRDVVVPMRDGAWLHGHVALPDASETRRPVVFVRSPYHLDEESADEAGVYKALLSAGYALVFLNERGRYLSGGTYTTLPRPREDGWDAIEWIIKQPWADSAVGSFGCSSSAENQMTLGVAGHPAHRAMIVSSPAVAIARAGDLLEQGQVFRGGVFMFNWVSWFYGAGHSQWPRPASFANWQDLSRNLSHFDLKTNSELPADWPARARGFPQVDAMKRLNGPVTEIETWMSRPIMDSAWGPPLVSDQDDLQVPTLWLAAWFDYAPHMDINLFESMRRKAEARGQQSHRFVMAPGMHCEFSGTPATQKVGDRTFRNASLNYVAMYVDWFDAHMKTVTAARARVAAMPALQTYSLGANRWYGSDQWPPKSVASKTYHLAGKGILSDAAPQQAAVDKIAIDPLNPVPSTGGVGNPGDLGSAYKLGALRQDSILKRSDVMAYFTDAMSQDTRFVGNVKITLHVAAATPDADVFVKLVEQDKRGVVINFADTVQRLSYRKGYHHRVPMKPGEAEEVTLPTPSVDITLKKGHRLGIIIAGSDWPQYTLNANTGEHSETTDKYQKSELQIHYGPAQLSRLEMPMYQP